MLLIIPVLFFYICYRIWEFLFPAPRIAGSVDRVVVISGCDTGFGYLSALELDKLGFSVIAGCLTENGCRSLQEAASSRLIAVKLDITQEKDIQRLLDLVKSKTDRIHALINNAGISAGFFIDTTSLQDYRKVMEVNFFGHVAMSKAFFPLLIPAKGRVVNITSVAGLIATPGMSTYSSSKFALEAFSDVTRREFGLFGIHTSIIEPGFMKTPIVMNGLDFEGIFKSLPLETQERWGEHVFKSAASRLIDIQRGAQDPKCVIDDIVHAVTSTRPKLRYKSGWFASTLGVGLMCLPTAVQDFLLSLAPLPKPKAVASA